MPVNPVYDSVAMVQARIDDFTDTPSTQNPRLSYKAPFSHLASAGIG